jgi:hypothetical protein
VAQGAAGPLRGWHEEAPVLIFVSWILLSMPNRNVVFCAK